MLLTGVPPPHELIAADEDNRCRPWICFRRSIFMSLNTDASANIDEACMRLRLEAFAKRQVEPSSAAIFDSTRRNRRCQLCHWIW